MLEHTHTYEISILREENKKQIAYIICRTCDKFQY